jgi:alkylhydroperoxidase family enzyme
MTWLRVGDGRGTNYERVFSLAPEAYAAWRQLGTAVRQRMDERRYELVTVAAAEELGSRYCTLAHGQVLRERFPGDEGDAGDRAAVGFARKIAADPRRTTAQDVQALRDSGLSDVDVLDVVLAVATRRFFTAVLHATGTQPDPALEESAADQFVPAPVRAPDPEDTVEEPWPARPSSA